MSAAVALSIAGCDPSGGAGIAADLKTFAALEVYGTVVVSALTAQSTRGVTGVHPVPAAFVEQQLDTLLDDLTVHATKIGMLPDAGAVGAVADVLGRREVGPVVCDPVMVATSGDALADDGAVRALRERLLPLADLVTPNAPEAAALLGTSVADDEQGLAEQARALLDLGPAAVLVKGGHLEGAESVDVLVTAAGTTLTRRPRVATASTHGTGCTLSSALAALLARRAHEQAGASPCGRGPADSDLSDLLATLPGVVETARDYLQEALKAGASLGVGSGHGPVHHMARWWP